MNIDQTIEQIEKLYLQITGQPAPANGTQTSILNPEMDPSLLLEARMQQLMISVQDPALQARLRPFSPPMSVWESEEKFMIRVNVAGVKKEDVDISVRGNLVTITGLCKSVSQDTGFQPKVLEMPFGTFQRTLTLPLEVGPSELDSKIEDGVLEIMISKKVDTKNVAAKKNTKGNQYTN